MDVISHSSSLDYIIVVLYRLSWMDFIDIMRYHKSLGQQQNVTMQHMF
jgi:hypothetical protein